MPEEEAITFEFIREIQREEQRNTSLTKISEDFYDKVKSYVREKKKLVQKKKDKAMATELRNIQRILEDIFNRRETKIMNHAIITARTGVMPQNLIGSEKEFFEAMLEFLKNQRGRLLEESVKKVEEEYVKVELLEDTLEFLGIDLKKYGPYNKGDIVTLPKDNAELFIKAKKVKKLGE